MSENTAPEAPTASPKALLDQLKAEFPVIAQARPLAIGIDRQLLQARPEINRKQLRIALGMHTHSVNYLKALETATERFDLQGVAAGEVSEEQRAHAATELAERLKKRAEHRKAARVASEAQAKAQRAEQQRAEKLDQLVNRFSRK